VASRRLQNRRKRRAARPAGYARRYATRGAVTTNRMMRTISLVLTCTLSATVPRTDDSAGHILVRAEYRAGGTCDDCFGWRVTITDDGSVRQQVKKAPGWNSADE